MLFPPRRFFAMMRFAALFALLASLLLPVTAAGQSAPGGPASTDADALFHRAAGHYIDGQAAQARQLVTRGLRQHPDHARLRALKEKLDQQKKQQKQGGSGQKNKQKKQNQNGNKQQQGQQKKKNQKSRTNAQRRQNKNRQQRKQGQKQNARPQPNSRKQQRPQTPQQQQRKQNQKPRSGKQQAQALQKQDKMSRKQAERILQAMRNQEEQLLREAQERERRRESVEKDW